MPNQNNQNQTNDNQQTPPQTGDTPPVVPDFMSTASNLTSQSPVSPGIPLTVEDTQIPPESFDISPSPNKKFGGKKIIATILGVLVLAGGIFGGVVLTRQNQDVREQAADSCSTHKTASECQKSCSPNKGKDNKSYECSWSSKSQSCGESAQECGGGGGGGTGGNDDGAEVINRSNNDDCGADYYNCGGVGLSFNFCLKKSAGKSCNESAQEQGLPVIYGAKKVDCNTSYRYACLCDPNKNNGLEFTTDNLANLPQGYSKICFDTAGSCTVNDGLCAVNKQSVDGGANGGGTFQPCGTVNTYYCPNTTDLTGGCGQNLNKRPANFCGVIQVDTACEGFKTTVVPCKTNPPKSTPPPTVPPTPVPTPTKTATPAPGTAMCVDVKAYTETWALLSANQLAQLKPNNKVNFCVRGSTSQGTFDKAKFTINGVAQAETITKRPSSDDYCQLYTIPSGTTSFNITAQIHHPALGWK